MVAQPKSVIKSYFQTGDKPTQAQFEDLIDSYADTGSGGSVSGPASSVDSQIALFNGTSGIVLKAATTTGILKATSGVIAAASSGTDYAPPTSGSSFLKGNGSGGFTNQSTINLSDLSTQGGNTMVANATGSSAAPTAVSISSFLDSAISSTQGSILYRSGSAWTSLGPGTSGQLLQTQGAGANPQWATASSSFVYLGTQTASNSATLNFASLITSTYDKYVFECIDLVSSTDGDTLLLRTSTNNGVSYDSSASDYITRIATGDMDASPTTPVISGGTASSLTLGGGGTIGNSAGEGIRGTLTVINPLGATLRKVFMFKGMFDDTSTVQFSLDVYGFRDNTADIDAVQFRFNSGNITSGKIIMYGVKNS